MRRFIRLMAEFAVVHSRAVLQHKDERQVQEQMYDERTQIPRE